MRRSSLLFFFGGGWVTLQESKSVNYWSEAVEKKGASFFFLFSRCECRNFSFTPSPKNKTQTEYIYFKKLIIKNYLNLWLGGGQNPVKIDFFMRWRVYTLALLANSSYWTSKKFFPKKRGNRSQKIEKKKGKKCFEFKKNEDLALYNKFLSTCTRVVKFPNPRPPVHYYCQSKNLKCLKLLRIFLGKFDCLQLLGMTIASFFHEQNFQTFKNYIKLYIFFY